MRYLAFIIAGFFAGIGGGLVAINFEIVNADSVGTLRSGTGSKTASCRWTLPS